MPSGEGTQSWRRMVCRGLPLAEAQRREERGRRTFTKTPESKIAKPFCTREDYLCTRESFAHGKALHTGKLAHGKDILAHGKLVFAHEKMWCTRFCIRFCTRPMYNHYVNRLLAPTLHTTTFKHVHTVSLHTNLDRSCENCAKIVSFINSSVGRWIASHTLQKTWTFGSPLHNRILESIIVMADCAGKFSAAVCSILVDIYAWM